MRASQPRVAARPNTAISPLPSSMNRPYGFSTPISIGPSPRGPVENRDAPDQLWCFLQRRNAIVPFSERAPYMGPPIGPVAVEQIGSQMHATGLRTRCSPSRRNAKGQHSKGLGVSLPPPPHCDDNHAG